MIMSPALLVDVTADPGRYLTAVKHKNKKSPSKIRFYFESSTLISFVFFFEVNYVETGPRY